MPARSRQRTPSESHGAVLPRLEDRSYLAYLRPTPQPFLHFASGHFPAATVTQTHCHPCIALHGCLHGPLILRTQNAEHSLEAGAFYLLGPGLGHSWRNDGQHTAATLSFLLETGKPGRWPSLAGVERCCRQLEKSVVGWHRFATVGDRELHQTYWLAADHLTAEQPRDPLTLSGALLMLLGQITERLCGEPSPSTTDLDIPQLIRRLILARVRDRLSITQIAREVGASPTRAKALFRQAFGCGIMTYFNQLKIWQAKRLLNDPALTVEQVSHQLGFSSPSYFSRAFLKLTGESPTTYRQRNLPPPALPRRRSSPIP